MKQIEMPLASFVLFGLALLVVLAGMVASGFRIAELEEEHAKCLGVIDGITQERVDRVMELDSMIARLRRPYTGGNEQ